MASDDLSHRKSVVFIQNFIKFDCSVPKASFRQKKSFLKNSCVLDCGTRR